MKSYDCGPVMDYIQDAWKALTRSMSECASLTDVKVMTHPVLYLPAGMAIPKKVSDLHDECYVQIRSLPKQIQRFGDVMPEDLPAPGALYLPNPYVVPGGRFNEMYGWDSYFIVLGLIQSGMYGMARGIVENFLFEIEHYGTVLNANRTYYLTRSQPPFLTAMIRAVYEDGHSFAEKAAAQQWLEDAYSLAVKYHDTWVQPEHMAGDTGLARYYDLDCGPVPELADDSTYFHDVIRWLITHPEEDRGYLVKDGHSVTSDGHWHGVETSCNPRTGVMREPASVDGYQLSVDFYRGDRAMRESGFDTSFRFGAFSGSTHHYAPVCLNSLLFRYEQDMAHFAYRLGRPADVREWNQRASNRAVAIHSYLWRKDRGIFADYDFVEQRPSEYAYLSAYYPLWAGLATKDQAAMLRKKLALFEHPGGMAMSSTETGMQWDAPFGWAPGNWIVVKGLMNYGYAEDAIRIARSFLDTITSSFATDATVREKYDVERCDAEVHVTAGYKENVIGFGWTNGVYLKLQELISEQIL